MKILQSYKWQYYGSLGLLGIVLVGLVSRYAGWFWPDRSFVVGNVWYLEQQRHVAPWSLEVVPGILNMWPYKALRSQRYNFIGRPSNLSFWLYNFTFDDTKRFFHEIATYGTVIKGIMESAQYASRGDQMWDLQNWFGDNDNITIIPDDRLWVEFQHAKVFLADTGFIMQTANITFSSFSKNREWFFMSTDTWVLQSLQQLFNHDWQWLPTAADALHPNLVVCPINCRSRLETLLESAQSSILMYEQYIEDNRIQKILTEKKKAWINIQLILGKYDDKPEKESEFSREFADNTLMQSNPYVHAKVILVDDQFLLLGSMNISATSLDKNREIGILLMDKEQIASFKRTFQKDWSKKK